MRGIFQKENANKTRKYGIYRHLPTYEKIIRNLVSFLQKRMPGKWRTGFMYHFFESLQERKH